MQRKPGFPVANCSIKMPDISRADPGHSSVLETAHNEDDVEHQQRRQQLINFGHSQWGFNNWNWSVTKQELDFVDFTNGKYFAGVVAFVSISVKNLDIHRENIGYATTIASTKGFAIYKSRKCAVTNALRETLLSFGGSVSAELIKALETHHTDLPHVSSPDPAPTPVVLPPAVPTPAVPNPPKPLEVKSSPLPRPPRKDSGDAHRSLPPAAPAPTAAPPPAIKNVVPAPLAPPVARAHPMPASLPPRAPPAPRAPPPPAAPPQLRPNSNELPKSAEMLEEEARAERKRRQRQAQEEFRLRQVMKAKPADDDKHELQKNSSSFDKLLMEIPTQDIIIEETGDSVANEVGKRKSPVQEASASKRRASVINRLDIVQAD